MEEETGQATIRLVKAYPFGPNEGAVYVYEVRPQPIEAGMHIEEFYICTFDDGNTEIVWGCGSTIREALENAIPQWAKVVGEEEENPFKEVVNQQERGE